MAKDALRQFAATHIDEDCSDMSGLHENENFYNCKFEKLNDLVLKDCVLNASEVKPKSIEDAINFTLTLNCFSFHNVTYSEDLFDYMLTLLILTNGNVEKRKKLIGVLGKDRLREIFAKIETFKSRER